MAENKHLSYASTLCGNCTEVCPIKINLHEMLLENRNMAVQQNLNGFSENTAWKLWAQAMLRPKLMNLAGKKVKDKVIAKIFKDSWGKRRDNVQFAEKSFRAMWKDRSK
jgi:L-lactate dehydrogenase complex protein LldF